MFRRSVVFGIISILTACSINPEPLTLNERHYLARKSINSLFSNKPTKILYINYYQALARSAKYNLGYRIKMVNIALQAGQLDVALFTMFPALNASSTLYTRSNDYSVSGINSQGTNTGLSSS